MRALDILRGRPGPLWLRFRAPRAPPVFVLAEALPMRRRSAIGPGVFGQPVSPLRRLARGHARDLSGFLTVRPIPLPGSQTPAGSAGPRHLRSSRCCPRTQHAEGSSGHDIEAYPGL